VITAVDANVLLDVFSADPTFGPASREGLRRALLAGGLVACDVVWAEVAAGFATPADADSAMDRLGVRFVPLDPVAATEAGRTWRSYLRNGGRRTRVLPDFLIGAHAARSADQLLTRDQGFYRKYFDGLAVLDPAVR
jgi:predicted nucleic acid-binding protein